MLHYGILFNFVEKKTKNLTCGQYIKLEVHGMMVIILHYGILVITLHYGMTCGKYIMLEMHGMLISALHYGILSFHTKHEKWGKKKTLEYMTCWSLHCTTGHCKITKRTLKFSIPCSLKLMFIIIISLALVNALILLLLHFEQLVLKYHDQDFYNRKSK